MKEREIKTSVQRRSFPIERAAKIDTKKRTVELAFSSEEPYERYFGLEVLDHGPQSIRLGRMKNGAALLLNHNPEKHVGVVESVAVGADRVGRATVRFGKGEEAEAALRDVQDGILRHVSVGYFVHRMVREEGDGREVFRAVDWEPVEVSLVPIPADPTVGVGRSSSASSSIPEVTTIVVRSNAGPRNNQKEKMENNNEQLTEADRVKTLVSLGEQYGKYVTQRDVAEAIRNGRSVEQFKESILVKMESRHTDTSALDLGMSRREVQRYSLGRALVAMVTADWSKAGFERECSEAMGKMLGRSPEGIYLPYDIFRRDFNVGTASEAGNLVPTELRGDMFLDALRSAIALPNMGVRLLPGLTGDIDLPRKTAGSTVTMLSEIGSSTETAPATDKVKLQPKRIGGYVEVSKQALIQAAIALEGMLREDLLASAAVKFEDQCLNGNGSAPNIKGIRQYGTTLGGTVAAGTNGGAPTWAHVVELESKVADQNAHGGMAGYLFNTKTRGKLKTTLRGSNLPEIWPPDAPIAADGRVRVNGYPVGITNNVPSNLTKGTSTTVCSAGYYSSDWSVAVMGLFGAPDVTVDPYSKADSGQVKIVLNMYADFALRSPLYFSVCEDWVTS